MALLGGIGGLVVGLGLGVAVAGSDDAPAPETAASSSPTAGIDDVASTDEQDTEEATDDAEAEPAESEPEPDVPDGSRANPYSVGHEVANDEWTVVLGEPREAWAEIRDENPFNDPPADGLEFWIVPVTATYVGSESGFAWLDLTVEFVGDDAVTYSDYCGVVPDDLMDVGELYEGGVAEGNVCAAVPAGASGLWTLRAGWSDPTFFSTD